MTLQGIGEYVEAIRERYRRAEKKGKGRIMDEAVQVTGYHWKALICWLRPRSPAGSERYGRPVQEALRVLWEATDRVCGQRLRPLRG